MTLVGRGLLSVTQRLRGSRSLELLAEIRPNARMSGEQTAALQLDLLRSALGHAERTVPYYRELFRSIGLRSEDVRSVNDLRSIPILTKDIVRLRLDDLISDDYDRASLLRFNSGGSTGVPLGFFHDRRNVDYSDAATFRALEQCGWRPGQMIAFFWGFNERLDRMSRWQFELRQHLRRSYQFDPFHADDATMEQWVRKLRQIRPSVAFGYASTIGRFAAFVLERKLRVPRVRGVFTTAESLLPAQREVIARAFGARVFDCYGSSEIRNIANECVEGRMHINADFVVLELDETSIDGTGTAPFILTSLRERGMPFIRYRNEDCGRLIAGTCTCGSGFPLLDLRIARVSDHFVFPGGRVVHGEYFTHLMYGTEGIALFQFHQVSPSEMVIWIVPTVGHEEGRRRAIERAVAEVKSLSPEPIRVDVREVSSIPLSAAGKHRFTRSDVAASTH